MKIEVKNIRKLDKNTLKAGFTLVVGEFEISDWTFHTNGERSWVNSPAREYLDKQTGDKKYAAIVRIADSDRYWKFQNWAVDQVKERLNQRSS